MVKETNDAGTTEKHEGKAEDDEALLKRLTRNAEMTRRVRYAAAARLRREKTSARLVVSFLSLVIIGFSITVLVFASRLTPFQVAAVNVIIIVISLYIIVINYEFDRRDFDRTIINLERSTSRLREFYIDIKATELTSKNALVRAHERYNSILRESPFPSDDRDYQYVLLEFPPFHPTARAKSQAPAWLTRLRHQGSMLFAIKWLMLPTMLIILGIGLILYSAKYDGQPTQTPQVEKLER